MFLGFVFVGDFMLGFLFFLVNGIDWDRITECLC